jgi:hypothetical protein
MAFLDMSSLAEIWILPWSSDDLGITTAHPGGMMMVLTMTTGMLHLSANTLGIFSPSPIRAVLVTPCLLDVGNVSQKSICRPLDNSISALMPGRTYLLYWLTD